MSINLDLRRKYYSTKGAAEILGISQRRIRKLLSEGRIKGEKFNGVWLIFDLSFTRVKPWGKRTQGKKVK